MATKPTVSGTREWATTSANVMLGCAHNCRYCYARATAARFSQKDPATWDMELVQANLLAKNYGKRAGTVMFPTTHDITPENLNYTAEVLRKLLAAGNSVLVVSKPHYAVIKELCHRFVGYKDQILFRFTIGSRSDDVLRLWEPGAPDFRSRFESLMCARNHGFATSVSMEPLLDTSEQDIVNLVHSLIPLVSDSIWLGKMNKTTERLVRNGFGDDTALMAAADALAASQSDERILALYARLKGNPKVKWKESIKKVVGIDVSTEAGLDV